MEIISSYPFILIVWPHHFQGQRQHQVFSFFQDLFRYFYESDSEGSNFAPLLPLIISPSWIRDMLTPDNTTINPSSLVWKLILTAKDLIYSPVLETRKNKYCTTEVYYPYATSRQLGLHQDVPLFGYILFNQGFPDRDLLDQETLVKV